MPLDLDHKRCIFSPIANPIVLATSARRQLITEIFTIEWKAISPKKIPERKCCYRLHQNDMLVGMYVEQEIFFLGRPFFYHFLQDIRHLAS